jgi:hypothetical protein
MNGSGVVWSVTVINESGSMLKSMALALRAPQDSERKSAPFLGIKSSTLFEMGSGRQAVIASEVGFVSDTRVAVGTIQVDLNANIVAKLAASWTFVWNDGLFRSAVAVSAGEGVSMP